MSASYTSKHGIVSRPQYDLYMSFVDLRNFTHMLPEDKKSMVKADFDTLEATVQGITIGVKVVKRRPYDLIVVEDNGAPFHFAVTVHFDSYAEGAKTDLWVEVDAELNAMMKMMLGSKIQKGLDKVIDSLVDASEGRMPEGIDPHQFGL